MGKDQSPEEFMKVLAVLYALPEQDRKDEYKRLMNKLPPSPAFLKKYRELYGDKQ